MSLDAFTLSAVSVVVLLAVLLGVVTFMASRSQQSRIEALERAGTTREPAARPVPETRAHREFCGAIHRLYPNARVGLDFQVKKDGSVLAIAEWLLPTPAPTAEELASAMAEYREEQQNQAYREAREAEYPSIGDQLDALYKARQGDPSELAAIDARIAEVKGRHPKPGQC
ncbi:MAG: XkdW family protein [Gammaproteobacteria bacterium]|nr:XkdW family protein [Gammaproteobacteria bacterium]